MTNTRTVQHELLLRWIHVPTWILIVIRGFRASLSAAGEHGWHGYPVWTLVAILNFFFGEHHFGRSRILATFLGK
jgi:hypothetical protein